MEVKTHTFILNRSLPKTGQTFDYDVGDDGIYQAGWWKRLFSTNNKERFIPDSIDGDYVVTDRATGLMWARNYLQDGCNNGGLLTWPNALVWALSLDFAGFTDWRLPNIQELFSLINVEETAPMIWDTFISFPSGTSVDYRFLSSTTNYQNTARCWGVHFGSVDCGSLYSKTLPHSVIAVRRGV